MSITYVVIATDTQAATVDIDLVALESAERLDAHTFAITLTEVQ